MATKKKPEKPGTCFVIMPFGGWFDQYYANIFVPAIKQSGLAPIRVDDLFSPTVIVEDIWELVQKATILLADLSDKNPNVFYELGLAHALGKPVIMVAQTMDDVPFDLRSRRVLVYDQLDPKWGAKLEDAIRNSIEESLKSPKVAVPQPFRKIVPSQAPEADQISSALEHLQDQVDSIADQVISRHPAFSPRGLIRKVFLREAMRHGRSEREFDEWFDSMIERGFIKDDELLGVPFDGRPPKTKQKDLEKTRRGR